MKYLKYGIFVAIIIVAVLYGYYSPKAQANATAPTLVASETATIATPTAIVATETASLQASETVQPTPEPLPEPATE